MTRREDRMKTWRLLGAAMVLSALAACGGGGGGGDGGGGGGGGATTYTLGGMAAGVNGPGLVLRNGDERLSVAATGAFTFATRLAAGARYAVTVTGHPANQTCSATNASGTMGAANVTDIAVACVAAEPPPPPPNTYTVGGEVTGLSGGGLVLTNTFGSGSGSSSGSADLGVSGNGTFTFGARVADGMPYAVSVSTQPGGQTCSVDNASGTIAAAHVSNIRVHCGASAPVVHSVGGRVINLNTTGLVLHNNGGDALMVPSGATSFVFAARVPAAGSYRVTVATQPGGDPNDTSTSQDCTVARGEGSANADVTDVEVTCGPMGNLRLLGSDPPEGATGVSRTVQPAFNFSSPLNIQRGASGFIRSQRSGGNVPLLPLSLSGSQLRFAPEQKLLPLTQYRTRVNWDPLAGLRGERLEDGFDVQFTTGDNTWLDVETIAARGAVSYQSSAALDGAGNAIAAWIDAGGEPGIQLSYYTASRRTWTRGSPLGAGLAGGRFHRPMLAMDDAGNALLVWRQPLPVDDLQHDVLWAARYSKSDGVWEVPRVISHMDTSSVDFPAIAVSGDGRVAVAWARYEQSASDADNSVWLRTSHIARDADWGVIERMDLDVEGRVSVSGVAVALSPQPAAAASPEVVVMWSKPVDITSKTYVWSRFKFGFGGFSGARPLSDGSADEFVGDVAFDPLSLDLHAVWRRQATVDGLDYFAILSNSWSSVSRTWLPINRVVVDSTTDRLASPRLANDASMAVLFRGGQMHYWPLQPDFRLPQPLPVTDPSVYPGVGTGSVVVDASGNAVTAWVNADRQVVAARRVGSSGWRIDASRLGEAGTSPNVPHLLVNRSGTVLAVWVESGALRARFFD